MFQRNPVLWYTVNGAVTRLVGTGFNQPHLGPVFCMKGAVRGSCINLFQRCVPFQSLHILETEVDEYRSFCNDIICKSVSLCQLSEVKNKIELIYYVHAWQWTWPDCDNYRKCLKWGLPSLMTTSEGSHSWISVRIRKLHKYNASPQRFILTQHVFIDRALTKHTLNIWSFNFF